MTTAVSGVVLGVYSKPVTTRFGVKNTYDLKLDDNNFYKNGFKKPPVEVGDSVTIEYEVGKYGNEIKKLTGGSVGGSSPTAELSKAAPTAQSAHTSKYNKPFPVPLDHGDRSIIRQNSLTNARETVIAQMTAVKSIMALDDLVDMIITIAYKFEEYSSGDREAKAADAILNKGKVKSVKKATNKSTEDEDANAF